MKPDIDLFLRRVHRHHCIAVCAAAALAACGKPAAGPPDASPDSSIDGPVCTTATDCANPACASLCQVVCGNGQVEVGEACDDGNDFPWDGCTTRCTRSTSVYLKASNPDSQAFFGSVALSADGSTLVVGASGESSAATGVNGDQHDRSMSFSGAAYVFVRSGTRWVQQAYIKASNPDVSDQFGFRVALSFDGSTLAVGAIWESSAATGIDGDQLDNSAGESGAVYVFTRTGATWRQQAYIKASNPGPIHHFGFGLALSGDGSTLAVGAPEENGSATGINGPQNNDAAKAGAVYVFARRAGIWSQQAYIKASNTEASDWFGYRVALSSDASTLAVGARLEDSSAIATGEQPNNDTPDAGAVYVFTSDGQTWAQQAYVKASNPDVSDQFGTSVALSGDGSTLAVGAFGEASAATGPGGDQIDNTAPLAGAVYVFARRQGAWDQQAYLKASNTSEGSIFGIALSLSPDGSILAIGAPGEDSAATDIGGDQEDNSAMDAGAVYMFTRSQATWTQRSYVKASNSSSGSSFCDVALSADGSVLAVGAPNQGGITTDIHGNTTGFSPFSSGAVYVFQ